MTILTKSAELLARSERVLAGGPATLSKMPSRYPRGIAPAFLSHGDGAYVWDVDGNRYVDVVAALGPILLGHRNRSVCIAVERQIHEIASSTLSTQLEVEVAELLTSIIPGAENCRFGTNGKDVTEAAVKLARLVTGKRHVIYCGYHGGMPDYLITTPDGRNAGGVLPVLAPYNHQVQWRDEDGLLDVLDGCHTDLAAIMLEVPPEPYGTTTACTRAMLLRYQELASGANALFILDEVVTGWRYALGGAQQYYDIQADLCTFSKGMANGYPVAALTGPRELMRAFDGGHLFLSTTFGGNPISLAACKATLETLRDTSVLETLRIMGDALLLRIHECFVDFDLPVTLRGNFARFVCDWDGKEGVAGAAELRTLWLQELVKKGVLAGVPWLTMCCYDTGVVDTIMRAVAHACEVLADVVHMGAPIDIMLECSVITDVFERYKPQR